MTKKIPDSVDAYVGSRVRLRRVVLGLSQEKLGDAVGVTFQQIQKYEKGMNRIGAGRLKKIAEVLGVSISFFYDGAEEGDAMKGFSDGKVQEVYAHVLGSHADEHKALCESFERIKDPVTRQAIVQLVATLAK